MWARVSSTGWGVKTAIASAAVTLLFLLLVTLGGRQFASLSAEMLNTFAVWIDGYPVLAAASFVACTAAARVAPLPTGALMTVTGGYLFGPVVGTALAATGAAAAAVLVHLAGRRVLTQIVRRRLGPQFAAVEREVAKGAFNYLLALRLLPVIPGWIVNLLPLAFPMPRRTVVLATFLGLLPISLIFAGFGAGLAALGETPEPLSADAVLRWDLVLPLAGLAGLALLPVFLRHAGTKGTGRRFSCSPTVGE